MRWSSRRRGILSVPAFACVFLVIIAAGRPFSLQEPSKNSQPASTPQQDQPAPPSVSHPGTVEQSGEPQSTGTTAPSGPSLFRPIPRILQYIVIIDAGHGGNDRGAQLSNGVWEKDFTLALARRLKNELLERGIQAHLLRETD